MEKLSQMVEIGFRVVRGQDWCWNDQDGGDGHVGTVVEVGTSGSRVSPDKTVIVQWDNGRRTNYRVGHQGAYDLLVFDAAPAGIKHPNKRCDGCGRRGIKGVRWHCTQCEDYDLCTNCYMANAHNIQHKFKRFLTNKSTGVLIPKRAKCTRSQAKGIFPGAKVIRGYDWVWNDQDGGNGNIGTVTDIRGWNNETESSVASVTWPGGSTTNVYRMGYRGKVDLKYVVPEKSPTYHYKEHLPVLGKDELDPSLVPPPKPCPFSVGDRVRVTLPLEILKPMQKGHGGWNPKMAELIGTVGTVHRITQTGDIRVQYPLESPAGATTSSATPTSSSDNNRWTFNPAALSRVANDSSKQEQHFLVKDHVRVIDDSERVKILQSADHGNWNEKMNEIIGQKGIIIEVYPDGDVRVEFSPQRQWTFNPACLLHDPPKQRSPILNGAACSTPAMGLGQSKKGSPAEIINKASRGDLIGLKQLLNIYPSRVDIETPKGNTALQIAAAKGHIEVVRFLLKKRASISKTDAAGDNALYFAMIGKNEECVQTILEAWPPMQINSVNKKKESPLHIAVFRENIQWAKRILEMGCDVNLQDKDGDTACHICITNSDNPDMIRLIMSQHNFNPELCNVLGFNIFHQAALKGRLESAKAILERYPNIVRVVKRDGYTALHLSAINGREEFTQMLIDKCLFLLDMTDTKKQTALHLAALENHVSIVNRLVRAGGSVSIMTSDGKTCLHCAILNKAEPCEEESNDFSTLSTESALSSEFPLDNILPRSPEWEQVKKILIRNHLKSNPNLLELAIACFLVCSGADPTVTDRELHRNAYELVDSNNARAALKECFEIAHQEILASEFSNFASMKENPNKPISTSSSLAHGHSSKSKNSFRKTLSESLCNSHSLSDECRHRTSSFQQECMSCADELASVVFKPCGHKVVCLECCVRMKKCIKCHGMITSKVDSEGNEISIPPPSGGFKSLASMEHETVVQLEQKVRELQESNLCNICMERSIDAALRCGHRFCQKCASSFRRCPICRKNITGIIRLY